MTLNDLAELLEQYTAGRLTLAALQAALAPLVAADPLNVEASDPARWDRAHDDERLLWRLVYLIERDPDEAASRRDLGRVIRCLRDAGSADTFEMLPMLLDQERLLAIIEKHRAGVISRTGFLSVVAESGYAPHAKLWLEHADAEALAALARWLREGAYARVARGLERKPAA